MFIALLETRKKNFTQSMHDGLCGGRNFLWHWTEPHGRSGGILLGVDVDVLDIGSIEEGDFFCQIPFKKQERRFSVDLSGCLYGAAQPEFRRLFLWNLCTLAAKKGYP